MTKERKMYLDVDGVLAVWNEAHSCVELARGYGQLMRFCLLHQIRPYWLTCWSSQPQSLWGLNCLLWPNSCPTMAQPEVVLFQGKSKARAIDFESDFVWIEDGISEEDQWVLRERNAEDRFFWTNGKNPDCLLEFMAYCEGRLGLPKIAEWTHPWQPSFSRPRNLPVRSPCLGVGE